MARKKGSGNAGLAEALRGEVALAVENALSAAKLPDAKDIANLVKALKELTGILSDASGGEKKRRGRPPKAARPEEAEMPVKVRKGKKRGRKPSKKKCSVRGCKRPHYAKGLCDSHYNSSLRKKNMAIDKPAIVKVGKKRGRKPKAEKFAKKAAFVAKGSKSKRSCSVSGCGKIHYAKGFCRNHYVANKSAK